MKTKEILKDGFIHKYQFLDITNINLSVAHKIDRENPDGDIKVNILLLNIKSVDGKIGQIVVEKHKKEYSYSIPNDIQVSYQFIKDVNKLFRKLLK